MGIMDKAKQALRGRSETLEKGIDKAADMANKRTKGKYGDKLSSTAQSLKEQARKLDEERAPGPMGGSMPEAGSNPSSGPIGGSATGPTGGPTTGGPAAGPSGGVTTGPVEPPEERPTGGTEAPPPGQPGL